MLATAAAHFDVPHRRLQARELAVFGGRIAVALLLLEGLTHTLYVNAITRYHAWDRVPAAAGAELFTGRTMASLAFYKLIFLWLKFLVIWRVARLFALADGVDPPENMLRCAPAAAAATRVRAASGTHVRALRGRHAPRAGRDPAADPDSVDTPVV